MDKQHAVPSNANNHASGSSNAGDDYSGGIAKNINNNDSKRDKNKHILEEETSGNIDSSASSSFNDNVSKDNNKKRQRLSMDNAAENNKNNTNASPENLLNDAKGVEKTGTPLYGSQSYWESRYKYLHCSNNAKGSIGKETIEKKYDSDSNDGVIVDGGDSIQQEVKKVPLLGSKNEGNQHNRDDDNPLPFHEWYFTYNELRPLLLPIILGSDALQEEEEEEEHDGQGREEDDHGEKEKEEEEIAPHIKRKVGVSTSDNKNNDNESKKEESKEKFNRKEGLSKNDSQESNHIVADNNENENIADSEDDDDNNDDELYEDEEIWQEIEESDGENENKIAHTRDGLAQEGPVSILEVGCGDVPLGIGLATELKRLEATAGVGVEKIVQQIICTDYSETVINILKNDNQIKTIHKNNSSNGSNGDGNKVNEKGNGRGESISDKTDDGKSGVKFDDMDMGKSDVGTLQFVVADARKLAYPDCNFHLVLEKGTLDAVLSDAESGVANCIKIVAECSRVLRVGGFLVIISHHNAHTNKGLHFLNEVIIAGLRGGDDSSESNFNWSIEVHGNKGSNDENEDEDYEENCGPAVYIFNKKPASNQDENGSSSSNNNPNAFSVDFFEY